MPAHSPNNTVLPYLDPHHALAEALWRYMKLDPERVPRTSRWLWSLQRAGYSLSDLYRYLLKPHDKKIEVVIEKPEQIGVTFVGPILKHFRGERASKVVMSLLHVKNKETYHYWETGQRDLPLGQFLKIVDLLGDRLQIFCEMVGFKKDLREFNLKSYKVNFSERFFKRPWTPTVYLLIQSEKYKSLPGHDDSFFSHFLSVSQLQVKESLNDLADLELIRFDGERYITFTGVFYTPPNLNPHMLQSLNAFWMGKSFELMSRYGLHKIEQASVSYESRDKIMGWVNELREKIRAEVKITTPETVLHLQWQVADLLHYEKGGMP